MGRAWPAWPQALPDGGWALPGVKGAGLGQGLHSVRKGGCMDLLSSLKTSPYMPLHSGQNELTGKAPRSHGDEPGAQENCRLSPAWAPPPPPSPWGAQK